MAGSTTCARGRTSSISRSSSGPTTSRSRTEKFESEYRRGVELIRAGEYFAAHEELELAWRAAPEAERDFFQGLVHVAVAWYQAGRGHASAPSASSKRRCVAWRRSRLRTGASTSTHCSRSSDAR